MQNGSQKDRFLFETVCSRLKIRENRLTDRAERMIVRILFSSGKKRACSTMYNTKNEEAAENGAERPGRTCPLLPASGSDWRFLVFFRIRKAVADLWRRNETAY